jgi:hypothetical protein
MVSQEITNVVCLLTTFANLGCSPAAPAASLDNGVKKLENKKRQHTFV